MMRSSLLLIFVFMGLMLGCSAQAPHPPIEIPFNLNAAGYVSLVIENQQGQRVRNLLSATWFEKGPNITYWDGLDDLGRDLDAAHHGIYHVPGKMVSPGTYTVRGLVHPEIKVSFEFPIYSAGKTPWNLKDLTGGWLANHSAPQAAVFVPAAQSPTKQPVVFLGSYVTEGPDGVAWVDLQGNKQGGRKWIGGSWTAAPYMARDAGTEAAPNVSVYVASVWETQKGSGKLDLRISTLPKSDQPLISYELPATAANFDKNNAIGGIAVHNGIGVVSLSSANQLLLVSLKTAKVLGTANVPQPKGVIFEPSGNLLVISGTRVLRYKQVSGPSSIASPELLIKQGLEAPVGITTTASGEVLISDAGNSHQVKVFSNTGQFQRAIGKAGAPAAGPYQPLHMNNPAGITVDEQQQLWVTENDFLPKRVSVWSLEGKLLKAFYGPAKYGGGGMLDPEDQNQFYYAEEGRGTMQFTLDWAKGESTLKSIIYRKSAAQLELPQRNAAAETALYYQGKRYFTNCYNSNPTGGALVAVLFAERNGIAYPAAAMGEASLWPALKTNPQTKQFFIWTDLNADGMLQPAEVQYTPGSSGGITVMADLTFCVANLNGKALALPVSGLTAQGLPLYSLNHSKVLANGVQAPGSSGGNQVLTASNGWSFLSLGIQPFNRYSISGSMNGKSSWSYPNLWPGLHASHEAPIPDLPSELIGPTRLLGNAIELKNSDAGPLLALNSNHGMIYLFTMDGLFVSQLFEPMRSGKTWTMPLAERGMDLKGLSLGEENFWPGISQTKDGKVFLIDGDRSSLLRVEGLAEIRRLPAMQIKVSSADLQKSSIQNAEVAALNQKDKPVQQLNVAQLTGLQIDGKLNEWPAANWVSIDQRGVKAYFNAKTKPYDLKAAVAIAGDQLVVAYQTDDPTLLKNSGEMPLAPFKTGGALDLMIGADPAANAERKKAVAGDLRLLVTLVKGKPKALLYRAVKSGTAAADKVPFSSPWRTITFDAVQDISSLVRFAADAAGNFEYAVPLAVLNLKPSPGMLIKGDIGILRGDGSQTLARSYWNNKGTSIVSDVPSEAELTPNLWGNWKF